MQLFRRLLGYIREGLPKISPLGLGSGLGEGWENLPTEFADLTIGSSMESSTPKRKRNEDSDLVHVIASLERENADLKRKLQRLERDLDAAEHRNSQDFPGGESFLDTCATPHLLNKAVDRVYSASGAFTKLVTHALGVGCTKAALKGTSVVLERAAHHKFLYQALFCKTLFTDFENEYFNVEENAPDVILALESSGKVSFRRYKELLEDPDDDLELRRLCDKKRRDLVAALSQSGLAAGVADVGAVLNQVKVASSFVKFVQSVLLVHKVAFALRPSARIFRVRDGAAFDPAHMEAVVASGEGDDDDEATPLTAAIMVLPGFHVNRITVHSRVYTVKKIE